MTTASLAPVARGSADLPGLARRGMLSLAGAAISAVASLLVIVVVTRGVSRETAGHLFSATSVFVILESLCALGAATGLVYFIARLRALDRHQEVAPLLRLALRPPLAASLVMAVALFVAAPTLAGQLASEEGSAQARDFLRVLALLLPAAVAYDVRIAATQGFHTMTPTVLLEKVTRPLLQLILLAVAVTVGSAAALPWAWGAPYLLGLLAAGWALRRLVGRDDAAPTHGERTRVGPREFWSYTGPRGVASAAQLSLQRLDIVLVAFYLGPAQAAVYTAATRFVVLGQLGSQAVALAVQPKLSELLAREDLAATRRVYRASTAWVMAVTWPIHLLVALLAPVLLGIFGDGYGGGRWVVVILAAAMLLATACGMVTMLLLMAGRTAANLANVTVALVSNLILNLLLIPVWGIRGAAVAWAVSIVLSNLLPLVQVHRALSLTPFGPAGAAVAALAVGCFGVLPGIGWLVGTSSMVVGLTLVGAGAYVVGLWWLRELLALDELVSSITRRLHHTSRRPVVWSPTRLRAHSVAFYGVTLLALLLLVTRAHTLVLPAGLAGQVGHNSEALLLAVLVAAEIQYIRPRLLLLRHRVPVALAGSAAAFLAGALLVRSGLPPTMVTLNEPVIAAGLVLPYLALRRPLARAPLVSLATLAAIVLLFDTALVLDQAESLVPFLLAPLALDVFDRRVLEPDAPHRPGLRAVWVIALVGLGVGLMALAPWARGDLSGPLRLGIDYGQRAAEAYWGWLLIHCYFAHRLRHSPTTRR